MAANNVDGSVEIKVDMNVDDAEKELARLKKKIIDTESSLSIKKAGKNALVDQIRAAQKELEEFREKAFHAEGLGESGAFYTPEDGKIIGEMMQNLQGMEASLEKQNQDIEKTESLLGATKQRYGEIAKEKAPETAFKKLGNGIKSVLWGIGKVATVGGKAFSALGKGVLSVGKKIISAGKNLNVFSKLSNSISGSMKKLGSMIKQAFVFSVVRKGLSMIREQMGSYLTVNSDFTNGLAKIKGALLTAFQPIYDAVVPALTTMLNVLTKVIATFAQFTSSLFGTTAKQAQSNAKALNNQAKATKTSGKAAEKASKSMASFDEINTIATKDEGSGSGGGDTAPLFDYEFEEEPPFATWGEAFSSFLDKIILGIPKLDETFSMAADGINVFSGKLLEMLTFPGIEEKISTIGSGVATALNGLVSKINWRQMGAAFGAGINLALKGLTNFIYKFKWSLLGNKIATALNGAISKIDWNNVGMFLWSGFKIAIETLAGFLLGLNIPALSTAATNMATGFMTSLNETFASINWDELGNQVGGLVNVALAFIHTAVVEFDWVGIGSDLAFFLNGVLHSVDWKDIGTTISDAFHGAIDFLSTAIVEFDWAGLGKSLIDFLAGIDWFGLLADIGDLIGKAFVAALDLIKGLFSEDLLTIGADIIGGVLAGIWNIMANIGKWIQENIFDPFVGWFCDLFGIHSPSKVMEEQGNFIMEGLLGGITGMIDTVVGAFKDLWSGIKKVFSVVGRWFADHIINPLIGYYESFINFFIKGLNWLIDKINLIKFDVPDWVPLIGGKKFGFNLPPLTEVSLPRLATGAVIPPNREFAAVLGDQKRGTNIEAPADLIRSIVREEINSSGANRGEEIKIVFDGDLAALARILNPHIEREQRRMGANFVSAGYSRG